MWKRAAAIVWTLIIVLLCTLPGESLPDLRIFSADKLGHFAIFAGFGWLWMAALKTRIEERIRRVVVIGLIFAGLTEVYQGILPFGREPEVLDAVANAAGLLAGVWVYRVTITRIAA